MFVPITSVSQCLCLFRMMFRLHRLSVSRVFSFIIILASISLLSYDIFSTIHGGMPRMRCDGILPFPFPKSNDDTVLQV